MILNETYFFIMIIPNKREPQQITSNHSSDIITLNIMFNKDYTKEPYFNF